MIYSGLEQFTENYSTQGTEGTLTEEILERIAYELNPLRYQEKPTTPNTRVDSPKPIPNSSIRDNFNHGMLPC